MRRTFPTSGVRDRLHRWRDRRRYPWHYAELRSVKGSKTTSRALRRRLFVVRTTPGQHEVLIVAECPDHGTASAIAGERYAICTQGEMLDTPTLRRALTLWDASMATGTHRATTRRRAATRGVRVGLGVGLPR